MVYLRVFERLSRTEREKITNGFGWVWMYVWRGDEGRGGEEGNCSAALVEKGDGRPEKCE